MRKAIVLSIFGQGVAFTLPTPPSCRHTAQQSALLAAADEGAFQTEAVANVWEGPLRGGLSKMNTVMTPEFFETSGPLKQLYSQCVKGVRVKESSIAGAGLGLFATKNIKSGTIVSFYPAHALGLEIDDGRQAFLSDGESDERYFADHPPDKSSYLHATDQPIFNRPSLLSDVAALKDSPLYLDCNPNREVIPGWVSQYINDGARVERNSEEGVASYYRASKSKKNCIHIPFGPSPIMATVTTRKVKKGEELFTSYGCVYWLGMLDIHEEDGAPGMNDQIQQQIKESAMDLFDSMKTVSVVYATQIAALQSAFDDIEV